MNSKYEQLYLDIAEKIKSGVYSGVDLLPSEREFMEANNISRVTVRLALKKAKEANLIIAIPGKGHCVVDNKKPKSRVKTNLIGGIFAGAVNTWPASQMIYIISNILEEHGFNLLYSADLTMSPKSQKSRIERMLANGIDGLLVIPVFRKLPSGNFEESGNFDYLKSLHEGGLPLVIFDRYFGQTGLSCVSNDDFGGGYMGTEHLIKRGNKKIVYFAPTNYDLLSRRRYAGYCEAMKDHGLETMTHSADALIRNKKGWETEAKAMLDTIGDDVAMFTHGRLTQEINRIFDKDKSRKKVDIISYSAPSDVSKLKGSDYYFIQRPLNEIARGAAEKVIKMINGDKNFILEEYLKPEIINAPQSDRETVLTEEILAM